MKQGLLLSLILLILSLGLPTDAQPDTCLPPRFFGGQFVRVLGSVDAGGLPFRNQPGLSEPVQGFIPLDSIVESQQMERCIEGRNWYTVWYAPAEDAEPEQVWVMDGDGQTYWLEPLADCPISEQRIHIFPSPRAYAEGLVVDGFDEAARVIRFSANYLPDDGASFERHYFTYDLDTGLIEQTDYWHRDLITRQLTDQLGITEQVFGDGEDFSTVYVSPDRTKILYRTSNPPIPDCAHGCQTETLWIANSDGADPIELSTVYGVITRIVWGEDGRIHLSISPAEVWGPDFTLTVCEDGSCAMNSEALILEGRSLPFEYVWHMPVWSPNGEWISLMMGSEQLYSEGMFLTGFVLENDGNRYIQLPYNGEVAAPIVWLDDDTILYPVQGGIGWEGEDYGLPSYFYSQDALWEIHLDFETLTYRVGDRLTNWTGGENEWMYNPQQTHHIVVSRDKAIVYSHDRQTLDIYCFLRG